MSIAAETHSNSVLDAVAAEVHNGLRQQPRSLSPWLFYDEVGSHLFEQITALPEYYLTRTERSILAAHADEILLEIGAHVTVVELGAGTAAKTGLLLAAATRLQREVLYQPIDVSASALEEARASIEQSNPAVIVRPQVANYITDRIEVERPPHTRVLALYVGSSIGNFSPEEARGILRNLRSQLRPGDPFLLGTDLAPGRNKSIATLLAAYDDAAGVTAAFNRNILTRVNRDLGTDFRVDCFQHKAVWNEAHSRIEMHLEALAPQRIRIPGSSGQPPLFVHLRAGETIHTENSYKFQPAAVEAMLGESGFAVAHCWHDPGHLFQVTLANAI